MTEYRFVPCTIENGGFSSERTFTIALSRGDALVGTAHVMYLRNQQGQALPEGVPGYGEKLDGYVQCLIVLSPEQAGGEAVVEVPSADLIRVSPEELAVID